MTPNFRLFVPFLALFLSQAVGAAPVEPVWSLVAEEKAAVIETLRKTVNIETGSHDKKGLDRLAKLLGDRLAVLGGRVEVYKPTTADIAPLHDAPKQFSDVVIGRFSGSGTRKIMLLAHMDTVYPKGSLKRRPFRIDGNRLYGPGIGDAKSGVAMILHTLSVLKKLNFQSYGTLTVVINGDEEISSPGSRGVISRLGAEHDFVFSCEPSAGTHDGIALATSGIAAASLKVLGKSSHAGVAPELGRNALMELAHQLVQTSDLSDKARGIKFNWTIAKAGQTRNVIPDVATAVADVRVKKLSDMDVVERVFSERTKRQRIADAQVEIGFERRRIPLEVTAASRELGKRAQAIYAELGKTLSVDESGTGGGTDAAFAAQSGKPVTAEGFGLPGFNCHSSDEEYVEIDSIAPRLYLLTRLVMESAAK